jgi:transcriptional regulator with XRE-family HTH domain
MRAETDPRVLIPIARETGGAEVPAALDPGALVRDLRKARGLTLDQAAAQAGLARSTLSKIENGQMSPTCDVLRRLAEGLAISTPQLFTPPTRAEVTGRMAVTREGRGVAHATATWEHALLSATLSRRKMLPCRARIRARSMDAFDVRVRHDGAAFLHALSGGVRLCTAFCEPADRGPGDSACHDATMGHNVVSVGDEDGVILRVTSLG